jgi:GxxExxY protein
MSRIDKIKDERIGLRKQSPHFVHSVHSVSKPVWDRMDKMDYGLAGQVIGLAMRVHSKLGPGFLESVYQNALVHELRKEGFETEVAVALQTKYDDVLIGNFVADLLVNKLLLVENKAVLSLAIMHEVQLVNSLMTTGLDEGLLLNFGGHRLEFKKKFRQHRAVSEA